MERRDFIKKIGIRSNRGISAAIGKDLLTDKIQSADTNKHKHYSSELTDEEIITKGVDKWYHLAYSHINGESRWIDTYYIDGLAYNLEEEECFKFLEEKE